MPLFFVPNQGQSPAPVRFQARALGGAAFFTPTEVVLALPRPGGSGDPRGATLGADPGVPVKFVRVRFVGANAAPRVEGAAPLPGLVHEMAGSDRSRWRSNLPTYGAVVYRSLYEGVDLAYEQGEGQLKATYTVAPGFDPSVIRWRYEGAGAPRVDTEGNLRVGLARSPGTPPVAAPELAEHAPVAWQMLAGRRQPVEIRYAVATDGSIGFALPGGYDRTRPLTLDPTLTYSTLLGGGGDDQGYEVAVDAAGRIYVVGRTLSVDFPTTNAIDPGCGSDASCDGFSFYDAFVAKLDPSAPGAASLLFSTYLGGSANDFGLRIRTREVGPGGPQVYLTGIGRAGFPTTPNAYDPTYGGPPGGDAVLSVLSGDGSQLLYSTFLGGSGGDGSWGLDVQANGVASIAGQTFSPDFPPVAPYDAACGTDGTCDTDQSDAFVARIDPSVSGGAGLLYSTYLGGRGTDQAYAVRRDAAGRLHVAGRTPSTDFPVSASAFQEDNAVPGAPRTGGCLNYEVECDAFLSVLDPALGAGGLAYSSYLGGFGYEDGYSLAVDAAGHTQVVGSTFSSSFPATGSAFQPAFGGTNDAYLARFATSASGAASLPYATFLGGSDDDQGYGLALLGNVAHVAGFTRSTDFPTAGGPFQPTNGGSWDAFVLRLDPTVAGSAGLGYATYLGGLSTDAAYGIAVESTGAMAVTGQATSVDFPMVGAYPDQPFSGSDAFVARIDNAQTSADLLVAQTDTPDPVAPFAEVAYTVQVTNAGSVTATGV
ncbi:MAG TPA: SBBP repeat-containing protein, partial [Vicinamibacteria bacterium]